jgi:hypothetical protein
VRRLLTAVLLLLAVAASSACDSPPKGVNSLGDFDDRPCDLIPGEIFTGIIKGPYEDLAGVVPTLKGYSSATSGGDTFACVYAYEAGASQVPQVATMNVTVAHTRSGSQPYSVCSAGAQTRASGYRSEKIGDGACLSPSTDLWLKLGAAYFHVVAVPQPGFGNPVEANAALSPLLLVVAQAAADRMPRK